MQGRKYTLFLILMAFVSFVNIQSRAEGQHDISVENADTIGKYLQEVKVEGRRQRIIENGVSYIPDRNSKKFAIDAVDLLTNMQIPQLTVSADKKVRTVANQEVRIFIDYSEATKEDLSGIRIEDVARVEVLDYPADVRFHQAEHVVNFIMRRFEWGGYTKLTGSGRLLNDDYVRGVLYSKFSFRNWTFDLNGSGSGSWQRHGEGSSKETIRDFNFNGSHYYEITRTSDKNRMRGRNNRQNAGLRAIYSKDNIYLSHLAGFSRRETPYSSVDSKVTFSDELLPASQTERKEWTGMQEVWVTGNYYFTLPHKNNISATWTVGTQRYHDYSDYHLIGENAIANRLDARFHYPQISISHSKNLGQGNSINTTVDSYAFFHDLRYRGSADTRSRTVTSSTQLLVNYRHRWDFGLNMSARAGARYNLFRENGIDLVHRWSPYIHASVSYSLNSKNSLSVSGAWFCSPVGHGMTTGVIVRQDELFWSQGNPRLRPVNKKWLMLSYTLMPRNSFSLNAYVLYQDNKNVPVYDYHAMEGYDGLIKSYSDNNRERNLEYSVSGSLRLVGNSLVLGGELTFSRQWNRGLFTADNTSVTGRIDIGWYHRNISVRLFYSSPDRSIFDRMGYEVKTPCTYGLNFSYSVQDFKVSFRFANWFSQGYVRNSLESPHYCVTSREWSRGESQFVMLTLGYTLPYGKRVDRNNELNAGNGPALGF